MFQAPFQWGGERDRGVDAAPDVTDVLWVGHHGGGGTGAAAQMFEMAAHNDEQLLLAGLFSTKPRIDTRLSQARCMQDGWTA